MMVGSLAGRVILVAGAGGIGSGLAARFAADGAAVVLGDIDEAGAAATADEITQAGGTARAIRLDGSDEGSIADAVAFATGTYGGLDGCHVNFASSRDVVGSDILSIPLEDFDEVVRVMVRGFALCTRHALPALIARGGGVLLYTSSGAAHRPMPDHPAYSLCKAASHALMRHVATRFAPQGIRANVIAPGLITHKRFEQLVDQAHVAQLAAGIPVGRLGRPEDIAAMAALLMSDAGSYVNGQVISVDGGSTMRL